MQGAVVGIPGRHERLPGWDITGMHGRTALCAEEHPPVDEPAALCAEEHPAVDDTAAPCAEEHPAVDGTATPLRRVASSRRWNGNTSAQSSPLSCTAGAPLRRVAFSHARKDTLVYVRRDTLVYVRRDTLGVYTARLPWVYIPLGYLGV